MASQPNLRGIGAMLVSAGAFVANDSCMKLALADYPPLEVLLLRGLAACLWCVPLVLIMGHGRNLGLLVNPWILGRSLCEVFAILCFINGLRHLPIADLTAIVQITPLIVLSAAALIWGDHIGPLRWLLIGLGIAGALLVAQPGAASASPYAMLGFATALGAAARDIFTRKVPVAAPALIVALSTIVTVVVASAVGTLVLEDWVMPGGATAALMLAAGFFLMCGHLFVFLAFRLAEPRAVAPFAYSFIVWSVLSGVLIFGEIPNGLAIAGMALIVATGLGVVLNERRQRPGLTKS
jgi:drug/metabolite transporter (DMT)-like permease